MNIGQYKDGAPKIRIDGKQRLSVPDATVALVCSVTGATLGPLLLAIAHIRQNMRGGKLVLMVRWLQFSTDDRFENHSNQFDPHCPTAGTVVGILLEAVGPLGDVVVLDLHNPATRYSGGRTVHIVSVMPSLLRAAEEEAAAASSRIGHVLAPDAGAANRFREELKEYLDALAICHKMRDPVTGESRTTFPPGGPPPVGGYAVGFDDIGRSCKTAMDATDRYRERVESEHPGKVEGVMWAIVHADFVDGGLELLAKAIKEGRISHALFSDSNPQWTQAILDAGMRVVSCAPAFVEYLMPGLVPNDG